jgi:hypothetical protein
MLSLRPMVKVVVGIKDWRCREGQVTRIQKTLMFSQRFLLSTTADHGTLFAQPRYCLLVCQTV